MQITNLDKVVAQIENLNYGHVLPARPSIMCEKSTGDCWFGSALLAGESHYCLMEIRDINDFNPDIDALEEHLNDILQAQESLASWELLAYAEKVKESLKEQQDQEFDIDLF